MQTPNIEDAAPVQVEAPAKKPARRLRWILGGIGIVLLLGGLGSLAGYRSGLAERLSFQSTQVTGKAMEQYTLGLKDMAQGRLLVARERFQAVIEMSPTFPGAFDRLREVELALSITNTPTPAPTPTVEPTPDLRSAEELFNAARQKLADKDWQGALDTLESLRKENLDYRAVEVDGMVFIALRNRGMERISQGMLEPGLYDLTLAERFGYLDGQAEGLRTITHLYLTGASFWGIDWKQAAYYFSQVHPYYPGLRDTSGLTARDRYRAAALSYADQLAAAGDACGAQEYYQAVFDLGLDPTVEPTLEGARSACSSGEEGEDAGEPPAEPSAPAATTPPPAAGTPGITPSAATTETPPPGTVVVPTP